MNTYIALIVLCLVSFQIVFTIADYIYNDKELKRLKARIKSLEEKK